MSEQAICSFKEGGFSIFDYSRFPISRSVLSVLPQNKNNKLCRTIQQYRCVNYQYLKMYSYSLVVPADCSHQVEKNSDS